MTPPGAEPVWTPGARLAGFIKRNTIYCYKQNMKALGLVVLEKKIFYVFPIVCLWDLMTHRGGAIFDPRGMVGRIYKEDLYTLQHTKYESSGQVGRIYKEDHYTLLHTKYERSGTCGFGEEEFFYVFPIVSLWELSVAMETRVPIQPGPKPNATFPLLNDALDKI